MSQARRDPDAPAPVILQRGLWFEELDCSVIYRHSPGRTVSEADNTFFSTLTMNPQAVHLDAAASEAAEFGQRLVNSLLTLSVVVGLSVGHLTQGTIVANLGFTDVSFPLPVFAGDTLYSETSVTETRLSRSRQDAGIAMFQHTGRNQHGAIVVHATRATLVRRRPAATT